MAVLLPSLSDECHGVDEEVTSDCLNDVLDEFPAVGLQPPITPSCPRANSECALSGSSGVHSHRRLLPRYLHNHMLIMLRGGDDRLEKFSFTANYLSVNWFRAFYLR